MAWQDYPIRGFCPDLPLTTPGTSILQKGCYPSDVGIAGGILYTDVSSGSLNSNSRGAAYVTSLSNTSEIVVGTGTKLYSFDLSTTLTDRSGTAYSATDANSWKFTTFGNIVLAANLGDQLQQRTIGAAANFASVGAAPVPKASIVITAGPTSAPFVVVFDYNDGTNVDRDGWKCSAISDYTGWTAGTNQCATGRLLDSLPGPITCAIAYRDGIVAWKRSGMYVGTYTGAPYVWSWQRVSADVGCIGKNAAVEADDVIYWTDDNGIWMYDGSYPKRVPGYVQRYWNETVSALAPTDTERNFYRTVWDKKKHVIWFVPGKGSTTAHPRGLGFNTVSGLWCQGMAYSTGFSYPTAASATKFLTSDVAGTYSCHELITGEWGVSSTSNIASISYPNAGGASMFYGWVIYDGHTSPVLKGIRPEFVKCSVASASFASGGAGASAFTNNAPYEFTPGDLLIAPQTTTAFSARSPSYFDGMTSAAACMTFSFYFTSGTWEVGKISVDLGQMGRV